MGTRSDSGCLAVSSPTPNAHSSVQSQCSPSRNKTAGAQRADRLSQGAESEQALVCDFSPVRTRGQGTAQHTGRHTGQAVQPATSGSSLFHRLALLVFSLSVSLSVQLALSLFLDFLSFYLYLIFLQKLLNSNSLKRAPCRVSAVAPGSCCTWHCRTAQ